MNIRIRFGLPPQPNPLKRAKNQVQKTQSKVIRCGHPIKLSKTKEGNRGRP